MQWVTEEAFASALELHEAGAIAERDEASRREAAVQKSLDRRQRILEQIGEPG